MNGLTAALLRRKGLLLKLALSGGVLILLFATIDWQTLMAAWRSVAWTSVTAATLLLPVQLGFRMIRWKVLLRSIGPDPANGDVARTILAGYAMAVVTPAEVGDIAVRMHLHDDNAQARVAGVVLLEKLTHSLLSLLPGIPALIVLVTHDAALATLAAITMSGLVLLLVFGHHTFERWSFGTRWPRLQKFDEALSAMSAVRRRDLLVVISWTCCILAVYVVQEFILMNAVTTLGPVETWNGFWAGIGLRTLAPVFVMDLGIREASHVVFFGEYGVAPAAAMTVSLLMFAVNVLLPTIVGSAVFVSDRRGRR